MVLVFEFHNQRRRRLRTWKVERGQAGTHRALRRLSPSLTLPKEEPMFSDDAKMAGIANTPDDSLKMLMDLYRLGHWTLSNKMKFNVEKSKRLHLGRIN